MKATGAKPGRRRRAVGSPGKRSMLERARRLYADLADALEAEIERLHEHGRDQGDAAELKRVTDLVRQNQKALGTVLEIEAKLMESAAAAQADSIDMDDARDEITDRLDRLSS